MLSALLTDIKEDNSNGGKTTGLLGAGGDALDLSGFGVASLDRQTDAERAYSPLPAPSGQLIHDPDFSLPTTAGQLPWRLFHYSDDPDTEGAFGYGRRASWPLRLCATQKPPEGNTITVLLEREDGMGAQYVSTNGGVDYTPLSPRLFDTLTGDPTTGFVETRRDSGTAFHYPAGGFVSLSYFETVHGKRVTFDYDANQYLQSIVEPAGRTIDMSYNGDNYVESVSDWASHSHQFTYDSGDLQTIQDPEGHVTTFASDGLHRLTGIMAPTGFVTTFTYDDTNRVISRSVDGNAGTYDYLDGGQTVVYTDPYGKAWTTYLDGQGNVVKVVDPIGATRQAAYNPKGQPTVIVDGQLRQTLLGYDAVTGHETSRQEPTLGTYQRTYDIYANLLTDTDPLGRIHTYIYTTTYASDPAQRLLQTAMDPLGKVTTYTHAGWGAVETVQSPLGFVATYSWDNSLGLLTSETDPLGHIRTYQYDDAGNRTLERDEAGHDTVYVYDALGRQTSRTDPLGHSQQTVYDGVGNVAVRVDALGHRTSYTYNALGEETEEWDARGFRHTTVYDKKGREIARVDPNGHRTTSSYDFADNRTGQMDALGRITGTGYDLARRPTTLIDTTGLPYVTEYDGYDVNPLFRTVAQRSPSGQRTTSVYDPSGQLIASIDTAGHRTQFGYDRAGRLEVTVEPTGARTTTVYDFDGRTVGMIDALGHRSTSTYDARGQLTVSQDAEGKRYTTVYDERGLRTEEYSPDGTHVLRSYDEAGRATGTTDHLNLSTLTEYDPIGQVRTFTDEWNRKTADYYDGVGLAYASKDYLGKLATVMHDPAGRVTTYLSAQGGLTKIAYDASNAVTMVSDSVVDTEGAGELDEAQFFAYDTYGRFLASANSLGERTTTGYDAVGRVEAEIDLDGQATRFIYDGFGRWAAQEDADGYRVTTNFDGYGRQVGYTDELGYTTTLVMDLLDRPVAEIEPDGSVTTFNYDVVNRITSRVDPLGASSTTVYDTRGNVSARIDALGYRTTYGYDAFSRPVAVENALGYRTTSLYDSLGRVNATVNARGYRATTLFDSFSRPEATKNALGQVTTTVYDGFGRVEARQDALGYRTSTIYDGRGRTVAQVDALGYRTTTLYDTVGRAYASVDALGQRTTTLFDRVGRVTGQVSPLGFVTTTIYDKRGNAVAQMDARGTVTSSSYDARGQQLTATDAFGYVSTSVYDRMGRQIASVDPLGHRTTTTYDLRGQVTTRQNALGYVTTSLYDVLGRSVAQVDALGRVNTSVYDPVGRIAAQINALGEGVSMAYDEVGNRRVVVSALGYATSYGYDVLDRRESMMDSLGRRRTMVYDRAGRLQSEMDARGQATTHTYNGRGEETYRLFADGQSVSTVYDASGRTLQVWDSAGAFSYAYDLGGRLQSVLGPDYPGHAPVTYGYDAAGNRVGMASWWGLFTYAYDARNQMSALTNPGAYYESVDGGTTSFVYDARGQKVGQESANGTTTSLVYDALGRLLETRHVGQGNGEVARASYAYDAVGRPLFKDTHLARHTYSYDGLDRLVGEEISGLIGQNGGAGGSTSLVYDARNDFRYDSSATSANGAWQYGWSATLTADFVLDSGPATSSATGGATGVFGYESVAAHPYGLPIVLANDGPNDPATFYSVSLPKNVLLLHPGDDGNYSVLRFVAPYPGVYTFDGAFSALDGSTSTDVHIQRASDKTNLFSANQTGTSGPHPFSLAGIRLGYGEAIDFRVGDGGNSYGSDSTGLTVQVTARPVWNAVDDFTLTSNPNTGGAWSYGSLPSLGGAFSVFTGSAMNYLSTPGLAAYYTVGPQYDLPFLLANKTSPATTLTYYDTIVHPVDVLDLHTGSGGVYSALRFTAQVSGTYHLQGYFDGLDNRGYTATDVHVLKNGTINVWGGSHSVNGYGPSSVQAFDLSGVHLSSGDTVDFCVGEGTGGYLSDPTGLAVTITATAFDGSDTPVAVAGYQRTSWTYDAGGRRVGQEVNSGLGGLVSAFTTYAYDAADELLTSATGGAVTSFGYDANGSRTSTALPSGAVTSYAWDAANRLQAVTLPSGGTYTETYRSDGLRHAQTLPSNRGDGVEVSLWDAASGGNLAPLSWKGRVGTAASLLSTDATTQGTWKNTYGSDGFLIADGGPTLAGSSNLPRYAQVGFGSAGQLQWQASTSDVRGLQKPAALNDRIAAAFYLNPLVLDLNLKDERPHIVSLYLLDWDNLMRSGNLTINDADTNATLYSQSISGYGNGLWLRFKVSGHVKITLTNYSDTTGMGGSVVSGVFFDPIPEANSENGSTDLLAQVFGQGDELLSASGSSRHNIAVGRQYHVDAQGTVEATTLAGTAMAGGVQSAFAVDAWGTELSASLGAGQEGRSVEDNPFLFLGGLGYWQEPDLGLSYVRARWLDASNGQWMSVDPVDGEPRYEYAYNSPTLFSDASGTQPPFFNDLGDLTGTVRNLPAALRETTPQQMLNNARRGLSNLNAHKGELLGIALGLYKPDLSPHQIAPNLEPWYRHQAEAFVGTWQEFQSRYQRYLAPGMALVGLKFTENLEESSWKSMVRNVPLPFNTYLPPYYKDPRIVPYAAGFLWGALSSLYHFLNDDQIKAFKEFGAMAVQAVKYVIGLASQPGFWDKLGPMICDFYGSLVPALPDSTPVYEKGKRAAALLVNIVLLALTLIDLVALPETILSLLKGVSGVFKSLKNASSLAQSILRDSALLERFQKVLRGFGKFDKAASKQKLQEMMLGVQKVIDWVKSKIGKKAIEVVPKHPLLKLFEQPGFAEQFQSTVNQRAHTLLNGARDAARKGIRGELQEGERGRLQEREILQRMGVANFHENHVPYPSCEAEAAAMYEELKKLGFNEARVIHFQTQGREAFTSMKVRNGLKKWDHHQFVQVGDYIIDQTTNYRPELKHEWEKQFRLNGEVMTKKQIMYRDDTNIAIDYLLIYGK